MYFITCFQKYEQTKYGAPDIGDSRTFGYYNDRDVALEAVRDNWCDIQERIYCYVVVEYIEEGLYNPALSLCEYINANNLEIEADSRLDDNDLIHLSFIPFSLATLRICCINESLVSCIRAILISNTIFLST